MRIIHAILLLSVASTGLTGCAGGGAGPLGIGAIAGDRNLAASEPLFSKDEEDCLGSADRLIGTIFGSAPMNSGGVRRRAAAACERIRANFQFLVTPGSAAAPARYDAAQRNEIIDALMASSNRKCTRYAALLKNADGAMNAGLSVGAILTGGLGSILGGVNTARALAGSSSILSGSRAALNDTYLSNQTIHVLTAAFDKARRAQRRIITNRQACGVEQYTLMRGVEDAFAYHQSCSLVAGLAETALSIERSENPGLGAMRTQLNELANLRRQAAEFGKEGAISQVAATPTPASIDKLVAADRALVGAKLALSNGVAAETLALTSLSGAKAALAAQVADDKTAEEKAVADAEAALKKASAAVVKLTGAKNEAARAVTDDIHALVRATSQSALPMEPETRICPFNAQNVVEGS